jgi:hypothetical protein
MKIDLDSTSKRLCSAGLLALLIQQFFPDYAPTWLGGYFAITLVEQAAKPSILAH